MGLEAGKPQGQMQAALGSRAERVLDLTKAACHPVKVRSRCAVGCLWHGVQVNCKPLGNLLEASVGARQIEGSQC